MEARILLVEDDRRVRRGTALALQEEGFEVVEAPDPEVALRLLNAREPDIAILDVMLPGRDGFELCREIRKTSDLPVIFLTAKTDTIDVVVGLESGGDDYVTKPFVMRELIARVRALLRRLQPETNVKCIILDELEIEPETGVVRRDGQTVSLTKTEFKLICTLASRPNIVFRREDLLERVWGYDYLGDSRLVDSHVQRLRAKIEPNPSTPTYIRTVRGLGYKLAYEP
jgi:DNA-binding response OmpR family regulator